MNIIVVGAKGRMGKRVINLIQSDPLMTVAAEVDIGSSIEDVIDKADVLIDFSTPESSVKSAQLCARHKKPVVIGTTGFNDEQLKSIEKASKETAILLSPNMSVGVNLIFQLINTAAKVLGDDFKIQIIEKHHIHKKDKPSGTAKQMQKILNSSKRTAEIISFREGEIIGEHEIEFKSDGEMIRIKHEAFNRDILAKGAILAAKWIVDQKQGMYGMEDVI